MTRRRLTWTDRKASAPPAMPGYQEPSIHPAAYPDPEADAYENGDTSAWAEDPHPGPYTNPMHPALPGTDEPMGHPATDPAHYFPAGVSKQASRQIRAAMEVKAAKCIRIAQSMLGRRASVSAIEDQALDLMNLTERQIAAALSRLADDDGMSQDVSTESSADLLAVENMTLTPQRTSEEAMLAEMMADEEDGFAGPMSDEGVLAWEDTGIIPDANKYKDGESYTKEYHQLWEELGRRKNADDALLSSMLKEEGRKASRRAAQMPGGQNSPAHYNYRSEGVLASKRSGDTDVEAEEMLVDMAKDEAKKSASLRRRAKKSEDDAPEGEPAEDEAPEAQKKAAHFQRLAAYWKRVAKKSEEEPEVEEEPEAEEEPEEEEAPKAEKKAADRKAAIRRLAGLELSAEVREALSALLNSEEQPVEAGEEPTAEDFMMDDMGVEDPMLMDDMGMDDMGVDELSSLYGSRVAKKSEEEPGAEEEAPKAGKKAAVRPQPRKASNGVRSVGAVSKVASGDMNDLSRLWESAPDVSKIFG